jgi:hypothetical protein
LPSLSKYKLAKSIMDKIKEDKMDRGKVYRYRS